MKSGIEIIAAERERQITQEGWSLEHDAQYSNGELTDAAICYASNRPKEQGFMLPIPSRWPWHRDWWKPTPDDRIRELAKAGALIAAEIDRLLNDKK
jgi:hypothetical protein